jgi:hypothetical protein
VTFHLPSLLYKSALIQQEIEAEHSRPRPDRLRLMRLKTLRLKIMERLHALIRTGSFPALGSAGA